VPGAFSGSARALLDSWRIPVVFRQPAADLVILPRVSALVRRVRPGRGGLRAGAAPGDRRRLQRAATAPCVALALLFVLGLSSTAGADELTIGLIPEQNVFRQMKRYEPIADYIRERTGVKIRFTILSRYGNIIESFTSEHMDGAFWGSFTSALAIQKLGIEPIARPLWLDGTSTYHGFVFVRKDSGIENVKGMKGKTIAFVERATTAGYVFPMAYLKEHGVRDLDAYFKEYYFAGSHDATIEAVLEREADIGCAKNTIFSLVAARDPRARKDLLILAESPTVPSNGLGMRKDLDPALKGKLRDVLLGMDSNPAGQRALEAFGAIRFIATTKDDYRPVFEIAERAGIDLKNYQYVNE
jgi:phosphonate transport system substrate-binding protein